MNSSRLRLRQDVTLTVLTAEHALSMYCWMSDPAVSRHVGLRQEPTPEKTAAWIARARQDRTVRPFAVMLEGRHIGNVVLDHIDDYLANARLSVYIGESVHRGSGIGRTAIYLAACQGFEELALYKIWATVHARNIASLYAFSSLGFTLEGILRDEFWLEGQRENVLYMGLLVNEFKRLKEKVIA